MTSAAFLAAGTVKSNLAFTYWGCAFLLLLLLCVSGAAIEAARVGKQLASGSMSFGFRAAPPGKGYWFPGGTASFRRVSPLKRPLFPWITVDFARRYGMGGQGGEEGESAGIRARFTVNAPAGAKEPEYGCRVPGRGRWISEGFRVRVRDALGMFGWEYAVDESDEFFVVPEPAAFGARPPSGGGGQDRSSPESFRRSDELLDSRKYHPGDDARRINWKQFGHSGELFVRIGEREPPPKARYLLVIDPASPSGISRTRAEAYVEGLIALAAGCALELSGRGARVSIAAPGMSFSGESDDNGDEGANAGKVLSFLAGIAMDDGARALKLPTAGDRQDANGSRGIVIFCPPGSPRSEKALSSFSGAGTMAVIPLMKAAEAADFWMSLVRRRGAAKAPIPPWASERFNVRASGYAERLRRTANADAQTL